MIPRLHVITDDEILGRPDFSATATELLHALRNRVALHMRGRHTAARRIFTLVNALVVEAQSVGALLVVNDRADVALTARAGGVHLGIRSLPVAVVRALEPQRLVVGYSAHSAPEAAGAERAGADFILAGSIYQTPSHPGEPPAGIRLLADSAAACRIPVLAIGGVNAPRLPEIMRAGAHGAAVIRAVWNSAHPLQAAEELARLLEE